MKVFQKYALEFDGEDDYMFFGSNGGLDIEDILGKNPLNAPNTVCAWFKLKSIPPSAYYAIVSDNIFEWGIRVFSASFGGIREQCNVDVNDYVDKWVFVCSSYNNYDRFRYRIWIDGQLVKEVVNTRHSLNGFADLGIYLGWDNTGYPKFFGLIGEVRVYDRPLTSSEIQYLYNGGHIEDGLVFWLYPDEDSVTLDTDGQTVLSVTEKINGYVGTAYNGVKLVDGKDVELNKNFIIVKKV